MIISFDRTCKRKSTSLFLWSSPLPPNWLREKRRYLKIKLKRVCKALFAKTFLVRCERWCPCLGIGLADRGIKSSWPNLQQVEDFCTGHHLMFPVQTKNISFLDFYICNISSQASVEGLQRIKREAGGWQNPSWKGSILFLTYLTTCLIQSQCF